MQSLPSPLRTSFYFLAALLGIVGTSQAQNQARVEKIQRTVQKQAEKAPAWASAKEGTPLADGERVRTGKRSKTDIRFSDKSLLRLGALSSLELNGPREIRLLQGQLLFSALSPARILAGSAAAAIKGTVPMITVSPNGDAEFTLYTGAVTLTTPQGTRDLLPGQWIKVYANGTFSQPRAAAPFLFMNGGRQLDLLLTPHQEPFVGGNYDIAGRDTPDRQLFETVAKGLSQDANSPSYNPLATTSRPTGTATPGPTPGLTPIPGVTPTPAPTAVPTPLPTGGRFGGLAVAAEAAPVARTVASAMSTQDDAPTAGNTVAAPTGEAHLDDVDTNAGSINLFDARVFAGTSFGEDPGDGNVLGGRLGVANSQGKIYANFALTPIRVRSNNTSKSSALVTQAFLLYRDESFDFSFGRQQILDGPVQASIFGSMLRQSGRNTFDAVRFTSAADSDLKFDLVYLVDAAPRVFSGDVPGRQRGYYGRIEKRDKHYALGLNLLKFTNAPNTNSTGTTLDFAVPVLSDNVEVYGEVGRDPFKRKMQTVGFNLPGLYDKTGIDLYVETANLESSSKAFSPGREVAARLYKQVGSSFNLLAGASSFERANIRFVIGVSIGASKAERDEVINTLIKP